LEIATELISAGTSVDTEDDSGFTPLRLAISGKRHDFIDLFLKSSANTTNITASEWLEAYGREASDVVELSEGRRGEKTIRFIEKKATARALRNAFATTHSTRRLL
jgi:hypothetical protein